MLSEPVNVAAPLAKVGLFVAWPSGSSVHSVVNSMSSHRPGASW